MRVLRTLKMAVLLLALVFAAGIAQASSSNPVNHCADYADREPRYLEAIRAVAEYTMRTFEELCVLPGVLDIEAQPDRVIERDGTIIPHITVQLHRETDSCLYKVRDSDKVITSARCYSGF